MSDEFEEARKRERLQQLKILPFCVYITAMLFLCYWVLLSESVTVFGTEIYGFGKWLWFFVTGFMIGLSFVLVIGSLAFLVFAHRLAAYLKMKADPWRILIKSSLALIVGYAALYGVFEMEALIRYNLREINAFISGNLYRFDMFEILTNIGIIMASIFFAAFFARLSAFLVALPFKVEEYSRRMV